VKRLRVVLCLVLVTILRAKAGLGDTEEQFIAKYGQPSAPFALGVTRLPINGGPVAENSKDTKNFIFIYKQPSNELTVTFKDGKVDSIISNKMNGPIQEGEFKTFRDKYSSGGVFKRDMSVPQGIEKESDKQNYLNTILVYKEDSSDKVAVLYKPVNRMSLQASGFNPVVMKNTQR